MAKDRKQPKRIRVRLRETHTPADSASSVWVEEVSRSKDALTVRLLHDYADLKPAAGWLLEHDGAAWSVDAVDGNSLTCSARPALHAAGTESDAFTVAGGDQ